MPKQTHNMHRTTLILGRACLAALFTLTACGTDPTPPVEPPPVTTSVVTLPPLPSPSDVPAQEHEVIVHARGSGAVFTVSGEVFGQTGPIEMPARGFDSATFKTTKSVDQLNLSITIAGGACEITYDGRTVVTQPPVPEGQTTTCTLQGS
jgi:predicted small lipoprotein YifL